MKNQSANYGRVSLLQSPAWSRVAIVGVTLFLAWYWGRTPSLAYIGYILILCGVLVIVRYPQLGILGLVPIALLVPYSLGTGTQTDLNLAFLAIPLMWGVLFVRSVVYGRTWDSLLTRETWPLIGLTLTAIVSLISGYLPWNAFAQLAPVRAQLGALAIFGFTGGACILVMATLNSARWVKILTGLFLIIASIYMLGRAIPFLGFIDRFFVTAATGSVFWIWLVSLAAGQGLFNRQLDFRVRVLLMGLVALTLGVAFVFPANRDWASGWLPAAVSLALLLWFRWPRLAVGLGLLMVFVAAVNFQTIQDLFLAGDNAYSLLTRTAAYQILLQVIQVNPLLGVGPANYYYYTPLYSILGYYVKFNSHNQYIDILAQTGIIGLFFFAWFVVEMFRASWRLRNVAETTGHLFVVGYANAALGGLAGMLVAGALGDWIIPFVYNVGVSGFRGSLFGWLFLGGVLALKRTIVPQGVSNAG